jgi:hypothetical protein
LWFAAALLGIGTGLVLMARHQRAIHRRRLPSDSGSDALASYEPKILRGAARFGTRFWHGRRKTGCDGRDLLRQHSKAL